MAEADPHIPDDRATPIRDSSMQGHILRSMVIDAFVRIEEWARKHALSFDPKVSGKAPLSQILTVLRKAADGPVPAFIHPKRIGALLDRIATASKLRGDIIHAVMTSAVTDAGTPIWLFRNVGDPDLVAQHRMTVLTAADFKAYLSELKKLVKELNDQKLKATAPIARASTSG